MTARALRGRLWARVRAWCGYWFGLPVRHPGSALIVVVWITPATYLLLGGPLPDW